MSFGASTRRAPRPWPKTAQEMAPYKEGTLEGSIGVIETKEEGNRITRTVGHVDQPHYAVYMHEGIYNLGPGSQAKNAAGEHMVGRKYIERAAQWLIREWGFYERAKAAIKEGKK